MLQMDSSTQPMFSIVVTLWTLTLLYLPRCLFMILSPLLVAATSLFLILLRCNTPDKNDLQPQLRAHDHQLPDPNPKLETGFASKYELESKVVDFDQKELINDSFQEWDVRAPLEVIYEEESSEDEDEETRKWCLQRHGSLSRYFPESDSDTDWLDEWDSPGKICFEWEEDDGNGMIEISLDSKKGADFEQDENMIEIDIYPGS